MKTKICTKCGKRKKVNQFYRDRRLISGVHSECKVCHENMRRKWRIKNQDKIYKKHKIWRNSNKEKCKSQQLKTRHGITLVDYNQLLKQQKGCCAICGCFKPRGNRDKYFHVDHNHKTGQIRGLLCCTCNWFLGIAKLDNPKQLKKLVNYLKASRRVPKYPP